MVKAFTYVAAKSEHFRAFALSKMVTKWIQKGTKMGAQMAPKWFPKVVRVFTYAAAKSEHFRAFALSKMVPKWIQNGIKMGPTWVPKWMPKCR